MSSEERNEGSDDVAELLALARRVQASIESGDTSLEREDLQRLIQPRFRSLFDSVAGGETEAAPAASPKPLDGRRFREFELLELVGSGGMGEVYRARRPGDPEERALKTIRPALLDDAQTRQRFEREARLLSELEHPGICPVIESDTRGASPYLLMPFLPGRPLSAWIEWKRAGCPDLLADRGTGSKAVSPPEAWRDLDPLIVVESVARALHFAHERGLVHRDVKPDNILLSDEGLPVLVDFGLIRSTQDFDVTHTRQPVGTPPYMSPEQVLGHLESIDHRTDVYALGVTLFELLTLTVPFEGATQHELYHKILHDELPSLPHGISRDLAIIVRTALEKDPSRRYGTALDLAEDLRRLRERERIRARPPTLARRLDRWVRRNAVASVAMVTLALGLGSTSWFWMRSEDNRRDAVLAGQEAVASQQAESLARQREAAFAKEAQDEAGAAQHVLDFFIDVLERADPWKGGGPQVPLSDALALVAAEVSADQGLEGEPTARALITARTGSLLYRVGRSTEAEPLLRESLALHEQLYGETDARTLQPLTSLASLLQDAGEYEESLELGWRAVAAGAALGEDERLNATLNIGGYLINSGKVQEGCDVLEGVLHDQVSIHGEFTQRSLTTAHNLGTAYWKIGRFDEAIRLLERAVEGRAETFGPDHPSVIISMNQLGIAHGDRGDREIAKEILTEVLERARRSLPEHHPLILSCQLNLVGADFVSGAPSGNVTKVESILEEWSSVLPAGDPKLMTVRHNLAEEYLQAGRIPEAKEHAMKAYQGRLATLGPDALLTLLSEGAVGKAASRLDEHEEAIRHLSHATEGLRKLLGFGHQNTLVLGCAWGDALLASGKAEEALERMRVSLAGFRSEGGAMQDTWVFTELLAMAEVGNELYADAEARRLKLLRELESQGANHPITLAVRANLAYQYRLMDRLEEAEAIFLDLLPRPLPEDMAINARANLAKIAWAREQRETALEYIEAAEAIAPSWNPTIKSLRELKAEILGAP